MDALNFIVVLLLLIFIVIFAIILENKMNNKLKNINNGNISDKELKTYAPNSDSKYFKSNLGTINNNVNNNISSNQQLLRHKIDFYSSLRSLKVLTCAISYKSMSVAGSCDKQVLVSMVEIIVDDILNRPFEFLDATDNASPCNQIASYLGYFSKIKVTINNSPISDNFNDAEYLLKIFSKELNSLTLLGNYYQSQMLKVKYQLNGQETIDKALEEMYSATLPQGIYWLPPETYFLIVLKSVKLVLETYNAPFETEAKDLLVEQFNQMFGLDEMNLRKTINRYFDNV